MNVINTQGDGKGHTIINHKAKENSMKQSLRATIDVKIINETLSKKRVVFVDLLKQHEVLTGIDVIVTSTDNIFEKLKTGLLDAALISDVTCKVIQPIQFRNPIILRSQSFSGDTTDHEIGFLGAGLKYLREKNINQQSQPVEFTLGMSKIQTMEIDVRARSVISLRFEVKATMDNSFNR